MKPRRLFSSARLSFPLVSALVGLFSSPSASAVDFYWDGGTGNWTTISAWSTTAAGTTDPTAAPTSSTTDDLFFNRTANNSTANTISFAGGSRAAKSLTFDTSSATLFRSGASGNTTARTLTIGTGGITLGSSSGNVTIGDNPATYGAINIALGASQIWTNNSASVLTANGVVSGVGFNLTKSGTGLIRLNSANTYTGTTIIGEGTLAFTTANELAGGLTFGSAAGSTTTGSLDLSAASATFGGGFLVRTDSATANTISIGSSQTLQLNGAVTVGYNSAANSTTNLDVTGLGTLAVGTLAAPTNVLFRVGNGGTTAISNAGTLDMSGLSNFSAYLGTGAFRIGSPSNTAGNSAAGSTVILAADSTINAATLAMSSQDGSVTQSLKLGSGTNIINVGTINVGGDANGRSSGSLTFNDTTGTLKIRSQADSVNGRTTLNVGNVAYSTGTGQINNLFDTNGHSADLRFGTMTVGAKPSNSGNVTANFKFDTGTLDANDLIAGTKSGSSTTGTTQGIITLGGGTATFNNTTGPIQLGVNSTAQGTATGTLNVAGGNVSVAANAGTSIRLGNSSVAGGTANGNVNVTGGTLTLAGDIIRGDTTGTSNATLKISGGTLDMGGNDIGAAGSTVTLTAESGELKNVLSINGTGGFTKTTDGTLVLSGTNSYSGATTVARGTLQLGASNAIPDSSAVTVGSNSAAGTLDIAGFSDTLGTSAIATMLTLGTNSTTGGGLQNQMINSGGSAMLSVDGGIVYNAGAVGFNNGKALISANLQLGVTASVARALNVANSTATAVDLEITGVLSSGTSNGITKEGTGTLFLNNDNNTATGQFIVNNGTVQVTKLANTGSNSSLGTGSLSSVIRLGDTQNPSLEYVGATDSSTNRRIMLATTGGGSTGATILNNGVGKLTFSDSSFFNDTNAATIARTLTLGGANTLDNTISGGIRDNTGLGGTVGVTKQDAGTWILDGDNTYKGTTTVTAGSLLINGNQSTATGAVVVSNTDTRLMGTGTVGGATTINAGAIHSAGSATGAVGNQAFSSSLTYANGSIFEWDINANDTTTGFDTVAVTGDLNGATGGDTSIFRVVFGTTAKAGVNDSGNAFWNTASTSREWSMTSLFGKDFTSGLFTSVQTYDSAGVFDVSSKGSFTITGSTLNWTAVPEPTSALAGLLLTGGLLRRRR